MISREEIYDNNILVIQVTNLFDMEKAKSIQFKKDSKVRFGLQYLDISDQLLYQVELGPKDRKLFSLINMKPKGGDDGSLT